MSKQPKALRLAEALSARVISRWIHSTKQTPQQSGYGADAECVQAAAELRRLHAECEALRAENDALKKQPARFSLLRKPVKHISELGPCHCPPDVCSAPVIMGVQTPCLRHAALKEVDRE